MRQQNYRGVLIETGGKHLLISFFSHGFVNNYWYANTVKSWYDHRQNNLDVA
jgi:hypothetical protein